MAQAVRHFIETCTTDLRYGLRMLRRYPGFAAAAIVTFALGVGVNTAVFSVVNAIVLRPLAVPGGERLAVVASQHASHPSLHGLSFPDIQDFRTATADVFDDIAGYSAGFLGLAVPGGEPSRVLVTWVTGNYFRLLGLQPAAGRLIDVNEAMPGRVDSVVVLGHSAWLRRFAGDPAAVGRTVLVNGRPCTIVGVAPRGFVGTFAFSESELYLPLNWDRGDGLDERDQRGLHTIARLRPRISFDDAQAAMNVVVEQLATSYPASYANLRVRVFPERLARPEEDQFRTNTLGASVMTAMVALVMIVAAVNITNLLLARTASRAREVAVRSALGASRARLVTQMVSEALLLAALGGVAGVVIGTWAAGALAAVRLPGDLPVRFDFGLDGRVLAYAVTVTVLSGSLAGIVSAARLTAGDIDRILRGGNVSPSGAPRLRVLLVAGQVACCFVLLSTAGLFVRSLAAAQHADLGFRPDGVLNVHMDVGQLGYTEAQGRAFFAELERRVHAIPVVERAAYAFTVPMGYVRITATVEAEGRMPSPGERMSAGTNIVGREYFETMGVPIVRGRRFTDTDIERSRPVAIVNERLADTLWPGEDPLGRRFRPRDGTRMEVVGVTGTGKYRHLFEDPQAYYYVPIEQAYVGLRVLHIRASAPPGIVAEGVRQAVRAIEPRLPLYDVQTMTQALGGGPGLFPVRVAAIAAASFGLLAFALAAVGLYGVTSYLTTRRTQEFGVRVAIGAGQPQIVWLVVREGVRVVGLGVAAGLLLTFLTLRVVSTFLFGVSAYDPMTLGIVSALLASIVIVACAVPAWRAAHVDPASALRAE